MDADANSISIICGAAPFVHSSLTAPIKEMSTSETMTCTTLYIVY